jgi:hydrogenase maturation protein HypF
MTLQHNPGSKLQNIPKENNFTSVHSALITVEGVVQGVGFRPFIHRLAKTHGLYGFVSNTTTGVHIEVEGNKDQIDCFYTDIEKNTPPVAQIQAKKISFQNPKGHINFEVRKSFSSTKKLTLLSPDLSICSDCTRELFDPDNRRYLYPFINCTNCGPRFTIIESLPYDRSATTMKSFIMCDSCSAEYGDIEDRRYHAQPDACPECGPDVTLFDCGDEYSANQQPSGNEAVNGAIEALKKGRIVAIKGIGGFHLACDATNDEAVERLKERKQREKDKPLAVMVPSVTTAKKLCVITDKEEVLLSSIQRPIVLFEKLLPCPVSRYVSPDNKRLGVMLPYTPLHYILFADTSEQAGAADVDNMGHHFTALVMTSANTSDEPIVKDNDQAIEKLSFIADYILLHNRDILKSCDDSVVQVFNNHTSFIRRSRGYVPFPVVHRFKFKKTLACGAELKNTFCLTKSNYAFLSQHVGDLKNWETYTHFQDSIDHFKRNFQIEPELIACDLHPEYLSTRFAENYVDKHFDGDQKRLFRIQHHHAHIASCMAENGISEKVIGVAFDGTGFGTDSTIWGGEFLLCDYKDFERAAHLDYAPLAGGDSAIKEPWKMAVSYLYLTFGDEFKSLDLRFLNTLEKDKIILLEDIVKKGIHTVQTSSMGRLFDAVSAIVLLKTHITYEGQGAIELEQRIGNKTEKYYSFSFIDKDGKLIIDYRPVFRDIIKDVNSGLDVSEISRRFHNTIIRVIVETCDKLSEKTGLNKVAISGGCFQNRFLTEGVTELLEQKGFICFSHSKVPPNDGGVSLGQAIVANERSKDVCWDTGKSC